jgi:hypothetical protein
VPRRVAEGKRRQTNAARVLRDTEGRAFSPASAAEGRALLPIRMAAKETQPRVAPATGQGRLPLLVSELELLMSRSIAFLLLAAVLTIACAVHASSRTIAAPERPRLAVLTDIGGDPDDQQALVRLMVYANEFEIELLAASASGTPGELPEAITRTDLILRTVEAYGEVLPNLRRHADGWPPVEALRATVVSGNRLRGRANIGDGHDSAASRALIERIDAGTRARPLNIAIWGGQTDLAQALWRVKQDRGADGLARFVERFRVYDIADQDRIGDWMRAEFPGMFYILSKAAVGRDRRDAVFRGMYLTGDQSLTSRAWIEEHVHRRGPLGALYPDKTWTAPNPHAALKESDSPSWFFFLPAGGNDPADPTKPGWGGQFVREPDGWFRDPPFDAGDDPRETVSRWRPAFQHDFARRMAWCIAP